MALPKLDMTETLKLIDELRDIVVDMDGQKINVEGSNNKELTRQKAIVSKNLLYAAHVADLARASVMTQYHVFKGEDPPRILA